MKTLLLRAALKPACSGLFVWFVFPALLCSSELQVGTASVDITPNKTVALWGQFGLRISTKPDTPLTVNVVALESADVRTTFVSLDLLQLPEVFVHAIRRTVAEKDASINARNIVLTATHTHTAPVLQPGTPGIPVNDETMTVDETIAYLADKISDGIVAAWQDLVPGKMSYGLDRNSIGFSRRAVYANGRRKCTATQTEQILSTWRAWTTMTVKIIDEMFEQFYVPKQIECLQRFDYHCFQSLLPHICC